MLVLAQPLTLFIITPFLGYCDSYTRYWLIQRRERKGEDRELDTGGKGVCRVCSCHVTYPMEANTVGP